MTDLPEGLDAKQHVEDPSALSRALRIGWVTAMALFVTAGLLGAFGQRERAAEASGMKGSLELRTPTTVRGGLFFQAQIEVVANTEIEFPRLVLDRGWLYGLQVNSIEPSPTSEASRDGNLVLSYDTLEPGDRLLVSMHFQVEPTAVGRVTDNGVQLDDGTEQIARIERRLRRLP